MDDIEFWAIIDRADTPAELHAALGSLSDAELISFEQRHAECARRAYTWDLWGAAYVINGGCSDDCFDYFRAALISLGRATYENALASADSLADIDLPGEEEWEDWMSPSMHVVHARTGAWNFAGPPSGIPLGPPTDEEWDDDDLVERFPRLAEKHGY